MYSQEHHLLAQVIFHERLQQADVKRSHDRQPLGALGHTLGRILVAVGSRLQAFDNMQSAPATQR